MTTRSHRPDARGFTLLEALVALTILLVGLLGTLSALMVGANSDRSSRAQTIATKAAAELLAGLTQLPPSDAHLAPNASGASAPSTFGQLLSSTGAVAGSGFTAWSDASPIAGVRTDAELATGPTAPLQIERRWVVWDYVPAGAPGGLVRIISVSVIYRDPYLREVVMYGQKSDVGAMLVRNILTG